jgi:hypothetical protein
MEGVHVLLRGVTLGLHCNEVWIALGVSVREDPLSFASVLSHLVQGQAGTFVMPEQEARFG